MYLKEHIKNLRAAHGLSQAEFAKELGVSPSTIKKIEYGQTKHPGKKLLSSIAKFENMQEKWPFLHHILSKNVVNTFISATTPFF